MKKPILTTLLLAFSVVSSAALAPMTDEEMGDVTGKGIIKIDKQIVNQTDGKTMEFIKITQGLVVDINANIRRIRLGEYDRGATVGGNSPCLEGTTTGRCNADIDMEYVSLGTIDRQTGKMTTVTMVDPYIEFAIDVTGGTRKFAGLRTGSAYQQGILAGLNNVLTGRIAVTAYPGGLAGIVKPVREGVRFTELKFTPTGIGSLAGELSSSLASSPTISIEGSRNFWLGFQDQRVEYPDYGQQGAGTHSVAQKGFWLNMADGGNIRNMQQATNSREVQVLGIVPVKKDFYNQFPNNCLNGRQTTRAAVWQDILTAIHPNCR